MLSEHFFQLVELSSDGMSPHFDDDVNPVSHVPVGSRTVSASSSGSSV